MTSLRALWLLAHQSNWNDAGSDSKGRRLKWLECPSKCNAQLWGCDGKTPKAGALHDRYPGRFGEWDVPYCPRRLLAEPDPFVSAVLGLFRDYRAGVLSGWPDRYTAAIVDGVRYLDAEIDAAQSEALSGGG